MSWHNRRGSPPPAAATPPRSSRASPTPLREFSDGSYPGSAASPTSSPRCTSAGPPPASAPTARPGTTRLPASGGGLPHDTLQRVVRPNPRPVLARERHVRQRLLHPLAQQRRRLPQPHRFQLLHHRRRLGPRRLLVLLGVDRLQHRRHLL